MLKTPKTIRIEALRQTLGDAEVQRILTAHMMALHPNEPVIKTRPVKASQWEAGIKALTQNGSYQGKGSDNIIQALPAFRRFFLDNPRYRSKFVSYASDMLAQVTPNGNGKHDERLDSTETEILAGLESQGIPVKRTRRRQLATAGAK